MEDKVKRKPLTHKEVMRLSKAAMSAEVIDRKWTYPDLSEWMTGVISREISHSQAAKFAKDFGIETVMRATHPKANKALGRMVAQILRMHLENLGEEVPTSLKLAAEGANNFDVELAIDKELEARKHTQIPMPLFSSD